MNKYIMMCLAMMLSTGMVFGTGYDWERYEEKVLSKLERWFTNNSSSIVPPSIVPTQQNLLSAFNAEAEAAEALDDLAVLGTEE